MTSSCHILIQIAVIPRYINGTCFIFQIDLVAVSVSDNGCNYLCEAEEQAYAARQLEGVVDRVLQGLHARYARLCTALFWTLSSIVFFIEAAAFEHILQIHLCCIFHIVPSLLCELLLLLLVDGEAGAGDAELHQEEQEQDQHVKKQQHLMMFDCTN